MPSKPSHIEISTVGSQSDKRSLATFRDQHKGPRFADGRPFWGYLEMPSDPANLPAPIGELHPGDHEAAANRDWSQQWNAPWMPGPQYMEINLRRFSIYINYPRMIADFKTAMEDHYRKATEVAYEKNWPEPSFLGPIDHNIRHIIGRAPLSHKIPEAAMAGDPWILGLSDQPNEKLAKLLDIYTRQSDMWDRADEKASFEMAPQDIDALIARKVEEALAAASGLKQQGGSKAKPKSAETAAAVQPV
jgi:hypothetical protein